MHLNLFQLDILDQLGTFKNLLSNQRYQKRIFYITATGLNNFSNFSLSFKLRCYNVSTFVLFYYWLSIDHIYL